MARYRSKSNAAPEVEEQPGKELISVVEYAKRMNVSRQTVYPRLLTPETPNGDIVPEVISGKWKIEWGKYKDKAFTTVKRRTKVAPGSGS